jgi:hypothetical protein
MNQDTAQWLDDVQKRYEASTPGEYRYERPWRGNQIIIGDRNEAITTNHYYKGEAGEYDDDPDLVFFATAHQDVPRLLAIARAAYGVDEWVMQFVIEDDICNVCNAQPLSRFGHIDVCPLEELHAALHPTGKE